MNKILNWTFGACFRTLGRFLAIFIVFILLLFIGSKLDIEFPDWLGIAKVSASENIYSNYWSDLNGIDGNTAPSVISGYYGSTLDTRDNYFYYKTPKTWKINDFEYLEIPFYTNFYNIVQDYGNNTSSGGSININNGLEVFILTTINGNLSSQICNIKENTGAYYIAKCPFINGITNIRGFRVDLRMESLGSFLLPSISIGFSRDILFYEYNGSMSDISDNQEQTNDKLDDVNQSLQDTNQSIQDTNDNIMSDDSPNVSGMTDLAGYLPPGPLDSVLNLPLSILNSLNSKLSSSCSSLSLTLPFVNLPLNIPCLSSIFNQIAGLNTLFEFIGVICGALIMYSYLTYLYNWVDDVTSLRHNKARLFGAKSDADNWGGA